MPGIVGIVSQEPADECERRLHSMIASMEHECFYESGIYAVQGLGIYAGWVAHQNSFASDQVFVNESKDIAVVFSGECFIDPETHIALRRRGHQLDGTAGEWLVHLYEEEGGQFFEKLNGCFSGLLVDQRQNKVFLFNDRYGLERIYWHETHDGVYFASEAKALLSVLPDTRNFDVAGVADFLAFGCPVENRTLFRGISLLAGGSVWTFEADGCRKKRYFTLAELESRAPLSVDEFEEAFERTLGTVCSKYFQSKFGLGISLTAGLDTRMLLACRPTLALEPICYTYDGSDGETVDTHLAREVAAVCGYEHEALRLAPDFFANFASHADRTVFVTDGCFGVTGAHEIYMSRAARSLAPIRLTGVFGGEILRGVSTFGQQALASDCLDAEVSKMVRARVAEFDMNGENPVTFAAFREIPWSIFGSIAACRSQLTFRTPYLDNELVALAFQTPLSLRTSAGPSVRFIQLQDAALADIPTDMAVLGNAGGLERLWRRFCAKATFKLDYWSNDGTPGWAARFDPLLDRFQKGRGLLGRHKYLRYRRWFRGELSEYVRDMCNSSSLNENSFWNPAFVRQLAEAHIQGRRNLAQEINSILTLDSVQRLLLLACQSPSRKRVQATSR